MKLVQIAQVFQQLFQILAGERYLEMSMHNDVQHWDEPQTHVAQIHRDRAYECTARFFRGELFRVLSVES